MATYGYCPVWEDFYLVVCDLCGVSVKPQALKHHIEQQHGIDKVYLSSSDKPCDAISAATTGTASSTSWMVSSRQEIKQKEAPVDGISDVSCAGSGSSNKTLKRLLEKNPRRSPTSSFLVGDRREPGSSLSLYSSSDLPSDISHVGPLPASLSAVTTNTRHTNHDSLSSNSSNHNPDSYIDLRAALDGAGPENSSYSLFENGGAVGRTAPQVSSALPYSNCSNVRVSHGSISNSLNCRSTSRCSNSNSHGSNSTISNKLGLGISNGLDYSESNSEIIGRKNPSRTVVSPVLDFPSPSPCSLSKDDEDSLDSRLRALHSPQDVASPSLVPSSSLLPNLPSDGTCRQALPLENNPLHQPQSSLPDLSLDSNSMLNPSPHYTGQLSVGPLSVEPQSAGPHSVGPPSVGPPSVGPPSIGSIGPPSVGSSGMTSNHGALNTNRPSSMNTNISNGSSSDFCGILSSISPSGVLISMDNQMSDSSRSDSGNNSNTPQLHATPPSVNNAEEEEVKRISAMLQKEAEALAASQHLNSRSRSMHSLPTSTLPAHDVVEAQGLAGRRHHSSSSTILGVSPQLPHSSPAASHGLSNSSIALGSNSNDFSLHSSVNTPAARRVASNSTSQMSSTNATNNSNNHNNNSNMGSVPVPIGHMSVETLNQIQADLLATVSESDLNAVLNATPDSSDPSLLPNNSSLVYFSDNQSVQFSDSSLLNSDNFSSNPLSSSAGLSQLQFSNDQLSMPVLESNGDGSSGLQSSNFRNTNLLDQQSDQLRMSDASQSEELANAVNSITQPGQNGCANAFDSPAGSFMQPNSHLPMVVSSPLSSPSVSFCSVSLAAASPLSVSSVSSLPLTPLVAGSNVQDGATMGQNVGSSQGITVVIGGTATPITLPQSPIASTNKKPSGVLSNQCIVSQSPTLTQSPVQSSSFSSGGHTTPIHNLPSQSTTPSTPSPKKSSKKKRVGETRKIVPLKDREYNPEKHCGVLVAETGKPCTRSLTCKTHSLTLRRAVNSRSKKFDELLFEHRANKTGKSGDGATMSASVPGACTPSRGVTTPTTTTTTSCVTTTNSTMVAGVNLSMAGAASGGGGGGGPSCSPLLARSLSGMTTSSTTPVPLHQQHSVDSHSSLHPPASPYQWAASLACARPPRAHSDNFYSTSAPQPLATCSYNTRRLGGFLASEHKSDLLRSVIRTALKKPTPTQYVMDSSSSSCSSSNSSHTGVSTPSSGALSSAVAERLNNVKPLLARKLQATVPLNALAVSKDGITVGTGYNGHIQVAANSLGIVGTVAGGQLKRGVHHIESIASKNVNNLAKNKNKKTKISENGPGLNLLNSVVQIDTSGNAKNHGIPVVAVTIPNGLSTQQTFNISNVNFSGVRTAGTSQPIRIHPTSMKTYVRDQITGENRPTTVAGVLSNVAVTAATPVSAVGQTISTDGANIVLGSGATSYLIADSLKSFKSDSSGGIRLELHPSNAFPADSRFIHATQLSKVVTSSGVVAASGGGGSGSTSIPINSQQQQQQVTYLAPAVASGTNQPLTLQQVQQMLNRLQNKSGGLKLYASNPGTNAGAVVARATAATGGAVAATAPHHRTTYVIHQDNQPS